jgi:hypothetical protein
VNEKSKTATRILPKPGHDNNSEEEMADGDNQSDNGSAESNNLSGDEASDDDDEMANAPADIIEDFEYKMIPKSYTGNLLFTMCQISE